MKKEVKDNSEDTKTLEIHKTKTIELDARIANKIAGGRRVFTIVSIILIFSLLILLMTYGISLV